jgi:hypothetical protein
MHGTTQDFTQVQNAYGGDHPEGDHAGATQQRRTARQKPPARYEAVAIAIMLLIVLAMPLFAG